LPELDFAGTNIWFALSCAFDAVVVLASLRSWGPVRGTAAALGVLAVKGVVMLALGLSVPFGVAHVLWLDLVVVVPLAGAWLLVLGRARVVAALALLFAPVGAYASFVEPERLVTERAVVELGAPRNGSAAVRIGVISDLQFEHVGSHERDAVERLMSERPDVILVPGDFHQARVLDDEELSAIHALLRRLRAPSGVFAVQGDVESIRELRRVLEGTGIVPLVDEVRRLRVRDRTLRILGVRRSFAPLSAVLFEAQPGDRDVRILLAHRPDVVLHLRPDTRVDLVVAGHTHGGQAQLPLLGPPFTASEVPRDVAAGGLHDLDGRRIYVSRGVGVERNQAPKLRFGSVPEVSVLTLR
jgi:predicted MPP superfamily phosphohydrolase